MALNDKQQRFVDEYLVDLNATQAAEQLAALRSIAKHIGLIASCSTMRVTEEELTRRLSACENGVVESCLEVISDQDAHPFRRTACGILLECFVPDWRDRVDPHIVGMVVDRNDEEVRQWRLAVLKRDGYKCTECGDSENLHAHHIVRWADAPSLRVVKENGKTLCEKCHKAVHAKS